MSSSSLPFVDGVLTPPSVSGGFKVVDANSYWKALPNLASSRLGAKVVFATDEFFATADNLLNPEAPVFDPQAFTEFGKEMDGFETRRRRIAGYDWCLVELARPCLVHGIELDTRYFTGNFAPFCSLLGFNDASLTKSINALSDDNGESVVKNLGKMGSCSSSSAISKVDELLSLSSSGKTLVQMHPMGSGGSDSTSHRYFQFSEPMKCTHIRLHLHPDGGVTRMRVHGEVQLNIDELRQQVTASHPHQAVDVLLSLNGGVGLLWSDAHYGSPNLMLQSHVAPHMGDGWETARKPSRSPVLYKDEETGLLKNLIGDDWCILKLAAPCSLSEIEVDTNHFKGNFPESIEAFSCNLEDVFNKSLEEQREYFKQNHASNISWSPLVKRTKTFASQKHVFETDSSKITHIKFIIYPDGGVSRLRAYAKNL